MTKQALLQPITIGPYVLPNRIFMAPLTRSRSPDRKPGELVATYYAQRASAGLIISEGAQVSEEGIGYPNTPGIHTRAQVAAWQAATKAVHDRNGHIFCQLWHCGRMSLRCYHQGKLPLAPSAINPHEKLFNADIKMEESETPQAMTGEDIERTIKDFVNAANNAIAAGFDGVEIHAANGYLFHQFFNACANSRNDAYGGSHENKARFFFAVLDAVGQAIGFDKVGVRLNPSLHKVFGMILDQDTIPTFEYIIERLNSYKSLAYLHLIEPMTPVAGISYAVEHIANHFRLRYQGTLVINCGFDRDSGNRVITEGLADAVAFGKAFISNPDLVERIRKNAPWAPWDESTFYTLGEKGYTDYTRYTAN